MKVKMTAKTDSVDTMMGIDEIIINNARLSSPENRDHHHTAPKLMNYLIKHKHWSPFEMANISFEITTSRAIAQQLLRHRSFSFQEFSQRYAEVVGVEKVEVRKGATKNRQSSSEPYKGVKLLNRAEAHLVESLKLYEALLKDGVAKESARMMLPLATETTLVMNGTVRSWIHFLEQRCSEHAQKEVRDIADIIKKDIGDVCPMLKEALGW